MKLKVTKQFDFAHRGCDVKAYAKGDEIDTETADPELVRVATEEGWLVKPRAKVPAQAIQPGDQDEKSTTEEELDIPGNDGATDQTAP